MTSIAFDFDDIRRRRNQLLGLEPNGRVFGDNETPVSTQSWHIERPANWRLEQHRAAERAKSPMSFIGVDLASGEDITAWTLYQKAFADGYAGRGPTWALLDTPCKFQPPAIPAWFQEAQGRGHMVRFRHTGSLAIVVSSHRRVSPPRLVTVTVEWSADLRLTTYDGDVFLKNFELAE